MTSRITHLLSIAVAAAAVGCASATARFYTLDSTATANDAPAARYAVLVGPVSIPPSVDHPQLVVQVAPNRVEFDEFNRWAAPLNDTIARAVAGDLVVLLGTPDVALAPIAHFNAAYRVSLNIQRFDSVPGKEVLVDAAWTVSNATGGDTRSGHTLTREAVQGNGFDALAAAHSRALATVSSDIAAAIRAADADATKAQVEKVEIRKATEILEEEERVTRYDAGVTALVFPGHAPEDGRSADAAR